MESFWFYALLAVIFFILGRFFSEKKEKNQDLKRTLGKGQKEESALNFPGAKKTFTTEVSFEKHWNTGELTCDGTKCNDKHSCTGPERWLCRDVISKVIPEGYFVGQFWVQLRSKARRVDYAIETPEGKRIVVELDGYKHHVKNLKRITFDDQLLRQNELVCAGWTVLRFSFDQLKNNAEECREILKIALADECKVFNKTPVLAGKCLMPECTGEAHRLKSKEGNFFWKCQTCAHTFNRDKVTPVLTNRSCNINDFRKLLKDREMALARAQSSHQS